MEDLPSGTVTLLFTDVEGSTPLVQELGAAYQDALAEHREILRDAVASHAGREVDCRADELLGLLPARIRRPGGGDRSAAGADRRRAPSCVCGWGFTPASRSGSGTPTSASM